MDEKSSFDAFKLCWDVILQESAKYDKLCNIEYCKIFDSRDVNFEIAESRLAYIYKYGYFNISFFEKCFSLFINQCSDVLFSFENLKVCSLSNGPGFDVIGLLKALSISKKPLKGLPVFNAVNVHGSWSELYETLICKVYGSCIAESFTELFHLSQNNINFIQGDIYSTLSSEANTFISNSNILLMVNAFVSSKASPTTLESSLKKIFTLLQPGSLIFFIGSKNNMKLFSKLTDMKQYVKCICGPQKVSLDNLPTDEQLSKIVGVKPCNSGHGEFVVWQRRNENLKSPEDEQNNDVIISDVYTSSESLFPFCVKNHDELSDTYHSVKSELSESMKCCSSSESFTFVENSDESDEFISTLDKEFQLLYSMPEKLKTHISEKKPCSLSLDFNSVANAALSVDNKLSHVSCDEQKLKVLQQSNFQPDCNNTSKPVIETNHSILENSMSLVINNPVLKNAEVVSAGNKVSHANLIMNDEAIINQKTSKKRSRRKKGQSENQSLNENVEKDNCEHPKTLSKQSALNDSYKNSMKLEKEVTISQATNIQTVNYTDNGVQSLIHKCDNLVSKLEELAVVIKNKFNSSEKGQICHKAHFCGRQAENCQTFHHCCCCVKIVHSCCCRK